MGFPTVPDLGHCLSTENKTVTTQLTAVASTHCCLLQAFDLPWITCLAIFFKVTNNPLYHLFVSACLALPGDVHCLPSGTLLDLWLGFINSFWAPTAVGSHGAGCSLSSLDNWISAYVFMLVLSKVPFPPHFINIPLWLSSELPLVKAWGWRLGYLGSHSRALNISHVIIKGHEPPQALFVCFHWSPGSCNGQEQC